jgi:hypothetical protein
MPCEHTNVEVAKAVLQRDGHIKALDAVYSLTCPLDGEVRRNTRLASTIHTLRNEHGMHIETEAKPGMLADYHLTVPPKPWTIEAIPDPVRWTCASCGETYDAKAIKDTQPALGAHRLGRCPSVNCPSAKRKDKTVAFRPEPRKGPPQRKETDAVSGPPTG